MSMPPGASFRVGLISDTHGLLRAEALLCLQGCQHIIHGGDIGCPEILEQLASIAPLTTVRGNNDTAEWAQPLNGVERVRLGGIVIFAIHNRSEIDTDLRHENVRVVVSGHSHMPSIVERDGVVFVNPGSAGPRRFKLPITLGELTITGPAVTARIVDLETMSTAVQLDCEINS